MTSEKKKRALTPETRAKIIDAIAQEFHGAGMGDFNDAMRLLEEAPAYIEQGFNAGILIRVKTILDSAVEPSAEQLEETLSNINGKLRYMLRPAILTSLKQFKKDVALQARGWKAACACERRTKGRRMRCCERSRPKASTTQRSFSPCCKGIHRETKSQRECEKCAAGLAGTPGLLTLGRSL